MQTDPSYTKVTQSKIILKFLDYIEEFSKRNDSSFIHFQITPKSNISKHLIKNKFKLCDEVYLKEIK